MCEWSLNIWVKDNNTFHMLYTDSSALTNNNWKMFSLLFLTLPPAHVNVYPVALFPASMSITLISCSIQAYTHTQPHAHKHTHTHKHKIRNSNLYYIFNKLIKYEDN